MLVSRAMQNHLEPCRNNSLLGNNRGFDITGKTVDAIDLVFDVTARLALIGT